MIVKHKLIAILVSLLPVIVTASSTSEETERQPKAEDFFEIGAGFSIIDVPHYAGSDEKNTYVVPFPYFVYQSDKVSLNREGLKRHISSTNKWDLDISFAGTLPLDSEDNDARQGMQDLDWVGLGGPSINYHAYNSENSRVKIILPVRFGIATDFRSADYVGWEFSPGVRFEHTFHQESTKWKFLTSANYFYASEKFNDYYYSVDQAYATAERPEYQAEAGNAGYQAMFGLTRRDGNFWSGGFLRYRSVSGATFEDSPLVRKQDNFYIGVAFAWIIHSSK
ncbi:MipA/OmpV family protein [Pleionea mediterranea]|uniref:Outer membrane scaffolding protein for murein synthesis (MipA/OmpV family) n=1 Tax=Pleionea mediterranea TaxID=523701 RepID=A0A316FFY6_9GAMM|nr:MipA/OmpV family protein [Pleionea mediterranea]PWK47339.1 outer membrane scaffolding protein for murein synthesis (MipA/OmpV family) [Pleionea mediterranea]